MRRVRLDVDLEPLDVLRRFRHRHRLVALMGAWHLGEALIAFDPVRVLQDDPFGGIELPSVSGPGFGGGWIGAWGYQLGRQVERLPPSPARPVPQPDHRLGFYDHVLRLAEGRWWLEVLGDEARMAQVAADVSAALATPADSRSYEIGTFAMVPEPAGHREAVALVLEHIERGDIFQANVCARLESSFAGDPLDLFCAGVEALHPAYAAYVASPEGAIVSLSPELFLRRTGDEVLTSPIKGTAPLDADPTELLASAKDRAENVMIIDLMRNDLGRVCVPGSVRVPAVTRLERHAVWHLVSDVVGHRAAGVTDGALLRATFPPGSVTGAPKVRAMEIIHAVEATGREAYTGAIGHVSPAAGLELNVAIRTFEVADGRVWLGVGGGIVADSTPHGEYAECLVKARPLIEAVGGRLELAAESAAPQTTARPTSAAPAAPADRTLGVFDTLLVEDGRPVEADMHLARLDASVRSVYGTTVRAGLDEAVLRHAAGLSPGRHRLRVEAAPRGDDVRVTLQSRALTGDAGAWTLEPIVLAGGLGEHKWADRARLGPLADPPPGVDALVVDTDGSVLETGRASVFAVFDDGIHTSALDGRVLPGTARARLVELLLREGIPVHQRRLTTGDLASAHEVFVANALRGVVPVVAVDGVGSWPIGRTTAWLRELLRAHWSGVACPRTGHGPRPIRADARVLFIDNYDSFVYNLVQYVGELGATTAVVRHDAVSVDGLVAARERGEFTHVIVSPGPGAPAAAGISNEVVRRLGPTTPTLGVCLGHQSIAEVYGARVVRAAEVSHGKPSLVHHDGQGVYTGLPSPLVCARYHSLVVDPGTLPDELVATAHTAAGVVMGVRHRVHPVEGVQMHPESILTSHGHELLQNFLAGA